MKSVAFAVVAAIGLLATTSARADWFGAPSAFGFDGSFYYPGGSYRPSPYVVAGWGDDGYQDQRRYWGGPFWVDYRGYNPPYESYSLPRHRRWKHAH
jgi:hypothetical protein